MVQLNFDARQHVPLDNDTIPEGWYDFVIDESSSAPTKDGNPNHLRLNLRFNIISGAHIGRKVFTGLNMRHTNIQTMEMANRELSAICAAVGLPYVQDTQQLHNIPLKGRVKTRKDPTGEYDDRSEIKSYKPASFVPPGSLASGAPATAPAAAPTGWAQPTTPPPAQAGWGGPQQAPLTFPNGQWQHPQQTDPQPAAPQQSWQQPQTTQPWQQPPQQQAAPQQATQLPPVQYPEPQQQPPQQPGPAGFAAPTPPPQQPGPQAPQPQHPAQNANPPWHRPPGT